MKEKSSKKTPFNDHKCLKKDGDFVIIISIKQLLNIFSEGFYMRETINNQMMLGEIDISKIQFDPKSRDDIPQILKGLQFIYTNEDAKGKIFKILEEGISPEADKRNGRPGMNLWKILVMGVLRLNLNWDYDRLCEMINQHKTIREMLGHGFLNGEDIYHLQTIKDNVSLLTPEILDEINKVVVDCGHKLVKKKGADNEPLKCRADSFVVETNVHFPTDINLLFDALRKIIALTAASCNKFEIPGWRQGAHLIKKMKTGVLKLQRMKRSTSKNPEKKEKKEKEIKSSHKKYINNSLDIVNKSKESIPFLICHGIKKEKVEEIEAFIQHAERQMDQITRRVIHGEIIPHEEKIFSIFQPHTEWVCKGKAGVPVELGVPVAIVEDQFGFILHHHVMQKQTDSEITVFLLKVAKEKFPEIYSCSFDKGFSSKENKSELNEVIDIAALPKKGKLSKADKEWQESEEFLKAKKKHSAVESAINALGVHGLDCCPDHGVKGFKRYVSLAVLGRNLQKLGTVLIKQEEKKRQRELRKLLKQAA